MKDDFVHRSDYCWDWWISDAIEDHLPSNYSDSRMQKTEAVVYQLCPKTSEGFVLLKDAHLGDLMLRPLTDVTQTDPNSVFEATDLKVVKT